MWLTITVQQRRTTKFGERRSSRWRKLKTDGVRLVEAAAGMQLSFWP
jgi:hypothetical protein